MKSVATCGEVPQGISNETTQLYLNLPATDEPLLSFRLVRPWLGDVPVLDLGCAKGAYLRQLAPGSVGVDVSRPNLEHCR